jgi:anti-sigma regulatory factor (Ser/Thr protein kinase)
MQSSHRTWHFLATPAGFEQASADVRTALDECGVRGRARHNVELVFEEVVSNVVRHGSDDGRTAHIDLSLACETAEVVLTFDDDGRPYDPLQRPDPTLPTSLEDAPLGGLGIFLVRKASRDLHYERIDDKNRLTVTIANS